MEFDKIKNQMLFGIDEGEGGSKSAVYYEMTSPSNIVVYGMSDVNSSLATYIKIFLKDSEEKSLASKNSAALSPFSGSYIEVYTELGITTAFEPRSYFNRQNIDYSSSGGPDYSALSISINEKNSLNKLKQKLIEQGWKIKEISQKEVYSS